MHDSITYKTKDKESLELIIKTADNPEKILAVWPCTMGDVRMYKIPFEKFLESNTSVILYNPRGHGNSSGQMDYELAINDFADILDEINPEKLPVIALGHSGGCGGILSASPLTQSIKHYYLVAPVLNSRKSLFYMYENKTITEFSSMIALSAIDHKLVNETLSNNEWMTPKVWSANQLKEKLNKVSSDKFLIGSFLEELFIKGLDAEEELNNKKDHIEIFLASKDNWYPQSETEMIAVQKAIPVYKNFQANDHYFTKAWKNVWRYVAEQTII